MHFGSCHICFPAAGFTLVVSPLVSLMEDQLLLLRSLQVPAAALNASSGKVCPLLLSRLSLTWRNVTELSLEAAAFFPADVCEIKSFEQWCHVFIYEKIMKEKSP